MSSGRCKRAPLWAYEWKSTFTDDQKNRGKPKKQGGNQKNKGETKKRGLPGQQQDQTEGQDHFLFHINPHWLLCWRVYIKMIHIIFIVTIFNRRNDRDNDI